MGVISAVRFFPVFDSTVEVMKGFLEGFFCCLLLLLNFFSTEGISYFLFPQMEELALYSLSLGSFLLELLSLLVVNHGDTGVGLEPLGMGLVVWIGELSDEEGCLVLLKGFFAVA